MRKRQFVVAAVLALSTVGQRSQAALEKVYLGSMCSPSQENWHNLDYTHFGVSRGVLKALTAGSTNVFNVYCPVAMDNISSSTRTVNLNPVSVNVMPNGGTVTCNLMLVGSVANPTQLKITKTQSVSGTGNKTLTFPALTYTTPTGAPNNVATATVWTSIQIECDLAVNQAIRSYTVKEN